MRFIYRFIAVIFLSLILWTFCSFGAKDTTNRSISADAYEYIIGELNAQSEKIDIARFDLSVGELEDVLTYVLKNDPTLFFVNGQISYESSSDGKILRIYPTYSMSIQEVSQALKFCDGEIGRVLTLVSDGMSEYEKALILHDYICLNFCYDESLTSDDMYSFLKEGKGTCQGYTYTYMAMLRRVGIECSYAASDSMTHIWNLIKLDGEWYHVDVTWDDYPEVYGCCEYDNFLCSDTDISKNHNDWYSPRQTVCSSDRYVGCDVASLLSVLWGSGDVNADMNVDVLDLVLLELSDPPRNYCAMKYCADMDKNGYITEQDVVLLRKRILN